MKHEQDPRYEIKNEEITQLMRKIATSLAEVMPEKYGFALQIFSFGKGGDFFYISSAVREDMINMMKEFIERNEKEIAKEKQFWKKEVN